MRRTGLVFLPMALLACLSLASAAAAHDEVHERLAANEMPSGHGAHAGHDMQGHDMHGHDAQRHDQHAAHHAAVAGASSAGGTITLKLADTVLKDQEGRQVRLMSDLMGQRVTVVDFVYTTCTTVCPVLSATMAELQRQLGQRVGKDVQLVSITVDPQRDTPARLKEYAAKHDAGSGWRWLTGSKGDVDGVLRAFGAYTTDFESHPAMVMIGDGEGRTWTRLLGFPSVAEIRAQVDDALSRHAAHQN